MIVPQLLGLQFVGSRLALPQFENWAQFAIERVLNSLPEGLLIALFAWAVLRVLPRQNSRTRFAVWFLALLAVVGLPLFGGFTAGGLTFGASTFGGLTLPGFGDAHILGASSLPSGRSSSALALPAHWAPLIFLIWFVAASVAMARLAAGLWHLRELRRNCVPVHAASLDPSLRKTLEELNAAKSFASRPVTLATSERVRVPAALGLWKPMIVLPAWALGELPPLDLSIILRHEFAHLRRWDDWTNLVQKMVRALFFFHPAVWWIENRLAVEREMACDDVVVAQTGNPMGYASCLVSLLERSLAQRGWTMAQALVHRAREASERLARILDKSRPTAAGISKPALGLVGTFAVLCVAMLPQTPQFVAFDRSSLPAPADHEYSAALAYPAALFEANAKTAFRPAAVIPATLKIGEMKIGAPRTGEPQTGNRKTGASLAPQNNSKPVPARAVVAHHVADREAAGSNYAPAPESLIEVGAIADRNFQPAIQTLVFIEETQFIVTQDAVSDWVITDSTIAGSAPAATLWRVQVWRITFVSAVWERPTRVPVASKT